MRSLREFHSQPARPEEAAAADSRRMGAAVSGMDTGQVLYGIYSLSGKRCMLPGVCGRLAAAVLRFRFIHALIHSFTVIYNVYKLSSNYYHFHRSSKLLPVDIHLVIRLNQAGGGVKSSYMLNLDRLIPITHA